MSENISVNVDADIDLTVTVVGLNGDDVPDGAYEVDTSYGEIKVTIKNPPARRFKESKVLQRVKDLATENCPNFLPHLERLERELDMGYGEIQRSIGVGVMTRSGLTENDVPELGACPICGSPVLRIWGEGWDWDKAICSARGCDYFKELDVMTGHDPDGSIYIMEKPADDE